MATKQKLEMTFETVDAHRKQLIAERTKSHRRARLGVALAMTAVAALGVAEYVDHNPKATAAAVAVETGLAYGELEVSRREQRAIQQVLAADNVVPLHHPRKA